MGEYRIDELARSAGTTVRNVRAYQDRGLLPSPRREGRVGLYSDAHLARLRLIGALLERGYTLANIAELIGAWERGQPIADLLGFEAALAAPWTEESPAVVSADALAELIGDLPDELAARALERALALGILEEHDDQFTVVSPGMLETGALLTEAGVPLDAVFDLVAEMQADMDDVARLFVHLVDEHIVERLGEPLPAAEIPRLSHLVDQLRPLAKRVVEGELARAMNRQINETLGHRLTRLLDSLPAGEEAS